MFPGGHMHGVFALYGGILVNVLYLFRFNLPNICNAWIDYIDTGKQKKKQSEIQMYLLKCNEFLYL